jgi:hypothetical protein
MHALPRDGGNPEFVSGAREKKAHAECGISHASLIRACASSRYRQSVGASGEHYMGSNNRQDGGMNREGSQNRQAGGQNREEGGNQNRQAGGQNREEGGNQNRQAGSQNREEGGSQNRQAGSQNREEGGGNRGGNR